MNRHALISAIVLFPSALTLQACQTTFPPDSTEETENTEIDFTADDDEDTGAAESEILGQLTITDCSNQRDLMLSESLRVGKWILDTPEFNSCVVNGHNGITYRACDEDDVATVSAGIQAARSINAVELVCDNQAVAPVGGHAGVESFGYSGEEEINVASWVIDQAISSSTRINGISMLGNTIWHELMHQHGFRHGNSTAATATLQAQENRQWCGQNATWIWNQHSMPYFLGDCMSRTILGITEGRLTASGYSGTGLTKRERLIESAIARSHIRSSSQLDNTMFAVAWERKWVPQHSGKCLEITGSGLDNGAPVKQKACVSGAANQRWVALPLPASTPSGTPMRFVIMNLNSGKCLDRPFGKTENHTLLQQYTCHGGAEQIFIARANGQWEALGTPSNQCLDIPSHSQNNDVQLQMSNCKTTDIINQVFTLQL